jgi:hypothetical protein
MRSHRREGYAGPSVVIGIDFGMTFTGAAWTSFVPFSGLENTERIFDVHIVRSWPNSTPQGLKRLVSLRMRMADWWAGDGEPRAE